ncbi:MAG: ISAs1 family transposase [Planctomycetota bacterium]
MDVDAPRGLLRAFEGLEDPRMERTKHHSLARVRCERTIEGETSAEDHYYISSLPAADPQKLLGSIRGHWSVENRLHWSLDISFADDDRRTRSGHGAENASRLARIALNLLKAETTLKAGIKSKRLMCGRDHDSLLKVLTGPPKENSDA